MLAPALDEYLPTESGSGEDFPAGIEVYQQTYRTWSGEIRVADQWICAPRTVAEVVTTVNWAYRNQWRVRAVGARHGWAPLTVTAPDNEHASGEHADADTLLIDLSRSMNRARIDSHTVSGEPATVTAQTGITMESLLTQLERDGYGLASCPAIGDITLGGALAIGGHGTAVPVGEEAGVTGYGYGSISNLIVSVTAIVWDAERQQYVARTVQRADPRIGALLVHLGRALIVAATLRVGPVQRLRCLSRTDLGTAEVFARPENMGRHSFAAQLEACGRIESTWYPFTPAPWLKLWSVAPQRPSTAREVDAPYNYPFADGIDERQAELIRQLIDGEAWVTPLFTGLSYAAAVGGLHASGSADLWGWAKNTQLYVRPTTLRVTSNGYAVLTTRQRVQHVVSTFYTFLSSSLERYRAEGRFPINGPWELRVTGLDDPADSGVPDAQAAQLSAIRTDADGAFDTAVWLNVLTMPGTPDAQGFYAELEAWIMTVFDGPQERVRPEWSRGWAYDGRTAWSDRRMLTTVVPTAYRDGQQLGDDWHGALAILDRLDPHRVFTNGFLDRLTPPAGI